MTEKILEKLQIQHHEFSQLYREKKARIQEMGYSDFIEFLNWIENVNKGEKREEGKKIVDDLFNKYSDSVIISLFDRFRSFKRNKPEGYLYEKILNETKDPLRTEIYGDNIVKKFFGRYGNYLKFLKRKRDERKRVRELEEALKSEKDLEERDEMLKSMKEYELRQGAENHYAGNDRDVENEDKDIVINPQNEHIPIQVDVKNQEIIDDEQEYIQNRHKNVEIDKYGQYKILFEFSD